MPCFEYHPKRFVVEIDERIFEDLVEFCKVLLMKRRDARKLSAYELGLCICKILHENPLYKRYKGD